MSRCVVDEGLMPVLPCHPPTCNECRKTLQSLVCLVWGISNAIGERTLEYHQADAIVIRLTVSRHQSDIFNYQADAVLPLLLPLLLPQNELYKFQLYLSVIEGTPTPQPPTGYKGDPVSASQSDYDAQSMQSFPPGVRRGLCLRKQKGTQA